ncbi:hypothetical protein DQ354_09065 [Arthrobacter sp. AQ5-06]|nr:hypothetical protein DQ354_09065 [Arthrobacter sp. AQ5-06]
MFMFIIGFWFATIYKRWGTTGMLVSLIGSAVLLLGIVSLATLNQWWGSVGGWFVQQTPLTMGAWAAVLCLVLAGGSYLTLRRAIPQPRHPASDA